MSGEPGSLLIACQQLADTLFPIAPDDPEPVKANLRRHAMADAVIYFATGRAVSSHDVRLLEDEELVQLKQRLEEVAAGDLELFLKTNARYEIRRRRKTAS